VAAAVIFFLLSYDNTFWLAIRFNATRLNNYLDWSSRGPSWLASLPDFPVDIPHDVGVVIKTGYGTQHRLPAVLKALETGLGSRDIVVIADFTPRDGTQFYYNGHEVKVHDVLEKVLQDESLKWMKSTPRFEKYLKMSTAIAEGNSKVAQDISKNAGWELDAAKVFIPFSPNVILSMADYITPEHRIIDTCKGLASFSHALWVGQSVERDDG
jgi:hypothetical protein